jgi:hypothetical protein
MAERLQAQAALGGEVVEGAEHAAVQAAALHSANPPLRLADPGRVGRGEVQLDAGMGQEYAEHGG